MKSLVLLLLLAGCASVPDVGPVQICLMQPIGRSDAGYAAVRMQCEVER